MIDVRRRIDALWAGRTDVVVRHTCRAEGVYRAGDGPGSAIYGWETTLSPVTSGTPVWIWFDGLDRDLALMVDRRFWFEWAEGDDEAEVVSEVIGLCAGVVEGNAWQLLTRRTSELEVLTPEGRLMTVTDGRTYGLPWWGSRRVRSRRRLPAYDEGLHES